MKKRVLIQLLSVTVLCFMVASIGYYILCAGLRNAKRDSVGKLNFITLDTAYFPTVFFGASTIHVGMDPFLYDTLTGTKSFNASMDGIRIAEINLFIKKYIARHGAPRNIFISFDEKTLLTDKNVWYFSQYYPFINDTDFNKLIDLEPKLLLGRYAPALAITYIDDPLKNLALIGLTKDRNKREYDIPLKGFSPAYWKPMAQDIPVEVASYQADEGGWELLENTLDLCAAKNVRVDFILPPRYKSTLSDSTNKIIARLQSYEQKYNSHVFNFAEEDAFKSIELFPNRTHVNATGARMFTTLLAEKYIATIKESQDSTDGK